MILIPSHIRKIMPAATNECIGRYLSHLNYWMPKYGITTPQRVAHFLAQLAQESGQLIYVKEIASGEKYDTGKLAQILGNTPEKDGDGQRYKGRGLIQVTGKSNYQSLAKDWNMPEILEHPELLETPELAVRSACWFWWKKGLNRMVDSGTGVVGITAKVNGGKNGLKERMTYYVRAKKVIN